MKRAHQEVTALLETEKAVLGTIKLSRSLFHKTAKTASVEKNLQPELWTASNEHTLQFLRKAQLVNTSSFTQTFSQAFLYKHHLLVCFLKIFAFKKAIYHYFPLFFQATQAALS